MFAEVALIALTFFWYSCTIDVINLEFTEV